VAILVADVEPALEPDAGGKAEVGVVAAGGDEHDRRGADALCLRPSRRLRDLAAGVAPEASGLHRLGDRLEQRVVPLRARPPLPPAVPKASHARRLPSSHVGGGGSTRFLPRRSRCPRTGRARPPPGSPPSDGSGWRSSGRPWLWGCRAWSGTSPRQPSPCRAPLR